MRYIKFLIIIILAIVLLSRCASNSSKYAEHISVGNNPKHHTNNGYQNHPFVETAASKGMFFYIRRAWGSVLVPNIPKGHKLSERHAIQLLNSIQNDRMTWLGHASFLIKTSDVTILTDPFLTKFASPVPWAGPKRFVESPIPITKLPTIDIVIISHSHFDHLDDKTIRQLKDREKIHAVVPLGLKSFFIERGYKKVTELDWGQSVSIKGIKVTAQPSVHDSARSLSDHNETLWASWVIESSQKRILFVGDSGYSETIFNEIADKHGAFDYAIVPIGAYEPRELLWMSHTTPEEAVSIGVDVKATTLVASHWGTVSSLSDEPTFEPPIRFKKSASEKGFSEQNLWVMKVGETRPLVITNNSSKIKLKIE